MRWTELDRTGPNEAKLTQAWTLYTAQNMDCIFPLRVFWTLPHVFSVPHLCLLFLHSMPSDCLRKIQRLKKYFFPNFLFTTEVSFCLFFKKGTKKETKTKKFFGGIPQLRSYRLTSILRALKSVFFFFPEMWLCVFLLRFLFFHKHNQNNKSTSWVSLAFHATNALYSQCCRREPWPRPLIISLLFWSQSEFST